MSTSATARLIHLLGYRTNRAHLRHALSLSTDDIAAAWLFLQGHRTDAAVNSASYLADRMASDPHNAGRALGVAPATASGLAEGLQDLLAGCAVVDLFPCDDDGGPRAA